MMDYDSYIGKVIGHHRIIAKVASGAFASVYQAEHIDINDRIVAIKILHAHRSSQEKERENFLREAQLLVKLKHHYILGFMRSEKERETRPPKQLEDECCGSASEQQWWKIQQGEAN